MTSEIEATADGPRPLEAIDAPDRTPQHTPLWRTLASALQKLEDYARRRGSVNVRAPILILAALLSIVFAGMALAPGDVAVDWRGSTATWAVLAEQAEDYAAPVDAASDLDVHLTMSANDANELRVKIEETITVDMAFPDDFQRILPTRAGPNDIHTAIESVVVNGVEIDAPLTGIRDTYLARTIFPLPAGESTVVLTYTVQDLGFIDEDRILASWSLFGLAWPAELGTIDLTVTTVGDLASGLVRDVRIEEHGPGGFERNVPGEVNADATTYRDDVLVDGNTDRLIELQVSLVEDAVAVPSQAPIAISFALLPLVPLLLLGVVIIFAIAARRIAWGDARGRGWIVVQSEPSVIPAYVAARRWGQYESAAAADALQAWAESTEPDDRRELIARAKRAAHDGAGVLHRDTAMANHLERKHGLIRSRRGIVLEVFIVATVVLLLAQLGIVRQIAIRGASVPGWWIVGVCALTVLAALTIVILISGGKPLSRAGALHREEIEGIELYIDKTQLRQRLTADEPLLPYVAMFSDRAKVGAMLNELFPDIEPAPRRPRHHRGWLWLAVLIPVALIVMASVGPHKILDSTRDVWASSRAVEQIGVSVEGILDVVDGALVLSVTEDVTVLRDEDIDYAEPATGQLYVNAAGWNRWRTLVDGVWIDGEPALFTVAEGDAAIAVNVEVGGEVGDSAVVTIRTRIVNPIQIVTDDGHLDPRFAWDATEPRGNSYVEPHDEMRAHSRLTVTAAAAAVIDDPTLPAPGADGSIVMTIATPDVDDEHIYTFAMDESVVTDQDRADHRWQTITTSGVLTVFLALTIALLLAAIVGYATVSRWPWVRKNFAVIITAAIFALITCAGLLIALGVRGYYEGFGGVGIAALMHTATIMIAAITIVRHDKKQPQRVRSVRWQQWGSD